VHKQLFGTKNWFQTSDLIGFAVKRGTSRGCLFHRVMKHYVIQAGDGGLLGDTEDWTLRGKHYSQLDTWLLA
jgi:cyclophilin family peptidyl-prolyl cis-trans isomerase